MIDSLDIDHSLLQAMVKMQEGLSLLACVSPDKTRLHGCLQMTDLVSYMTSNWNQGEVDCFKIPLKQLDMLFSNELVRCKESDILFTVLRKMNDQRVNVISVDSDEGNYTVGLCFINDLLYLLRQPDYHFFLGQPVMTFLKELNAFDDLPNDEDSQAPSYKDQLLTPTRHHEEEKDEEPLQQQPVQESSFSSGFSGQNSNPDLMDQNSFFQAGAFGTGTVQVNE